MNQSGKKPSFHVAVVQRPPVFLNLEASLEKACALIEQAAGQRAKVVVNGGSAVIAPDSSYVEIELRCP